jgi:hypothetical protein
MHLMAWSKTRERRCPRKSALWYSFMDPCYSSPIPETGSSLERPDPRIYFVLFTIFEITSDRQIEIAAYLNNITTALSSICLLFLLFIYYCTYIFTIIVSCSSDPLIRNHKSTCYNQVILSFFLSCMLIWYLNYDLMGFSLGL